MKYLDALVVAAYRARPDMVRLIFLFSGCLLFNELTVLLLLPPGWVRAAGSLTVLFPALFAANALLLTLRYRRGRLTFYLHHPDMPRARGWQVVVYFALSVLFLFAFRALAQWQGY